MPSSPTTISAHGPGVTKLAFSKSGKKIYTSGDDCIVRIWTASAGPDEEPKVLAEADESVGALDTSRESWVAGGDDAMVRQYSNETDEMVGAVAQTGGVPVRCVAFNPKGDRLVVGSDNLNAKIVNVHDTVQCSILSGHTRGLRAATWHPAGGLLTTSGQDGIIIVWDTWQDPPTVEQEIDGLLPACAEPRSQEFSYSAAAVWHPAGSYFVVGSRSHEIAIVPKNGWRKSGTFSVDGHDSDITALAFSSNGTYLASAGKDDRIIIWNTETRKALFRQKVRSAVVIDLAWSPSANLLAWTDMDGALARWADPIPSSLPSPFSSAKTDPVSKPSVKDEKEKTSKLDDLFDDGDDTAMDRDELDVVSEDKVDDDDDQDWVVNDVGEDFTTEKDKFGDGLREMVNVTKAQPAFQPGATRFRGKKRYLAFNSIGVIEVSDQDIHHVVNVEFHDRSLRRGTHFQDVFRFSMAALGEHGIVYACCSEEQHPGIISYRPYDSWASNSEWQVELPAGENPIAVATAGTPYARSVEKNDIRGNGHVAVATTKGYIRFFSGGGLQRYVWTVGGEVVTMAGGAEWIFVVHREGGTSLDGCQNLRYTLISADSFDIVQTGHVPLPRGTVLTWIGVTTEGAPAMYDSRGVLSVLDRFRRPTQGRWVPALDTNLLARKVGKDETYWPVGLSDKEFLCIILKGGDREPGFPRPMIQEIEVQMPMLSIDTPQGQAEERLLRESIQLVMLKDASREFAPLSSEITKREVQLDKELIHLIQAACKGDRLQRALDSARLLTHSQSYDGAHKVAGFYSLVGLQEKIGALKRRKIAKDSGEDDEEEFNPRKAWGKVSEPIGKDHEYESSGGSSSQYGNGRFDDFAPPPSVTRRTLAPATPIGEVAFRRPPTAARAIRAASPLAISSQVTEESSMDLDSSFALSDAEATAKRKREEWGDIEDSAEVGPSVKKRSNGTTMAKAVGDSMMLPTSSNPKPSGNPFSRKPGAGNKPGNPFARNKSLVKSNSFFEKVDAAEADASAGKKPFKGKGKDSAKGKQTTLRLFGVAAPPPTEKKVPSRPKGKGKAKYGKEDESEEPKSGPTGVDGESQDEMGRVTNIAATLLEDSQDLEDTQLDGQAGEDNEDQSSAWAETQMEEETQPEDAQDIKERLSVLEFTTEVRGEVRQKSVDEYFAFSLTENLQGLTSHPEVPVGAHGATGQGKPSLINAVLEDEIIFAVYPHTPKAEIISIPIDEVTDVLC
ncbi:hypothetical protein FRB97_007164 [Tulasnella sp. 331]|nr:hypothetical protein FRB97_007164 [Tulasnella sp. 331]